jgi:hypothetical protein
MELGLWGGGPNGEDLIVQSLNPNVIHVPRKCVQEADNVRVFSTRGVQNGSTQVVALLGEGGPAWAALNVTVSASSPVPSQITAPVGRGGRNLKHDVILIKMLLNAKAPPGGEKIEVNDLVTDQLIRLIEEFQRRELKMPKPDGRVDPYGPTLRALLAGSSGTLGAGPAVPAGPGAPVGPPPSGTTPTALIINVPKPDEMLQSAWTYLLQFTIKHEGAVPHFYNNRKTWDPKEKDDVTCGIGWMLAGPDVATQRPELFYDPATNAPPTPDQLRGDWHEAQKMLRTGSNLSHIVPPHAPASVLCYDDVCKMRMTTKAMQQRMAEILKIDKLRGLLKEGPWSKYYQDFEKYPAPAQVFALSFAYGRLPLDFPKMNAYMRDWEFAKAATECHVDRQSEAKYRGHVALLTFAQEIKDKNLKYDLVPAVIF